MAPIEPQLFRLPHNTFPPSIQLYGIDRQFGIHVVDLGSSEKGNAAMQNSNAILGRSEAYKNTKQIKRQSPAASFREDTHRLRSSLVTADSNINPSRASSVTLFGLRLGLAAPLAEWRDA